MGNWNLTSTKKPERSGLYIVQRDDKFGISVEAAWYFETQYDTWVLWDYSDEEIDELMMSEYGKNYREDVLHGKPMFPCWCEMQLHDDVNPEYFYYYSIDEPVAWQELPEALMNLKK